MYNLQKNTMKNQVLSKTKFKYNFYEKKLWRIEDDYFYEISEQNRTIENFFMRGTRISFKLGEVHWLVFNPDDEFNSKVTVIYTKPLKNGELIQYKKKLTPGCFQIETTFEFTEADQVHE